MIIRRMLTTAIFAGAAAGLLAAVLHFAFVQDLLLLGERYETGEITHFGGGVAPATDHATLTHAHATTDVTHDHTAPAGDPAGGIAADLRRNGLTVLFMGLVYTSYALLLAAGFGLAERLGHRVTARAGILWGLAGFATFHLVPALGLAPELPGTIAADLGARQVWWWGTVCATGTAIALIAFGRGAGRLIIAAALLLAPHVIGAPAPDAFSSPAPAELGAAFAARSLGVGLAAWLALGWLAGRLWSRAAPS